MKNIGKLGKNKISENLVKEIIMTNEEILKAAQSSKEDIGEYEKTVVRKSLAYGSAVGVGLCMLMVLLELLIFKKIDFGKPALLFAIAGYADFYGRKVSYANFGVCSRGHKRKSRLYLFDIFTSV